LDQSHIQISRSVSWRHPPRPSGGRTMTQETSRSDIGGSLSHIWRVFRQKGVLHLAKSGAEKLMARQSVITAQYWYCRVFKSWRRFTFRGERYRYLYHKYNHTWKNERTVEIPIVWKMVQDHRGKRILEVGNVLPHYYDFSHEVVDKFEKGEGIANEDVVDFRPAGKYDLIVTVSTLEHVGWDEDPGARQKILGEPAKILKAIENLRGLLAPGGKLVITLPLGYNPQLDRLLDEGMIASDERHCLKRVSGGNKWREVDWVDCRGAKYGSPYQFANAVVIGIISNP